MPDTKFSATAFRVVFMGSPEFAEPSLRRLIDAGYAIVGVYTQPDRAGGRGRRLLAPPVKQLAQAAGLPVFQPRSLRDPEAIAELTSLGPDLIVIVAYGQILRSAVLAIPPKGTLNVHASLLPSYRGASPVASALLNGAEETGVSIMLVDEGTDTGAILAQRTESVLPQDSTGVLSGRLAALGADLLVDTVPRWLLGQIEPLAQDEAHASVTRLISKDDGRLDWTLPADELWRRVRAYTPWPGASTSLHGQSLQILQAWPVQHDGAGGKPGVIIPLPTPIDLPSGLAKPAFAVQTGRGLLLPLILQKAGRRPLEARDFANGERGLVGLRLGSQEA